MTGCPTHYNAQGAVGIQAKTDVQRGPKSLEHGSFHVRVPCGTHKLRFDRSLFTQEQRDGATEPGSQPLCPHKSGLEVSALFIVGSASGSSLMAPSLEDCGAVDPHRGLQPSSTSTALSCFLVSIPTLSSFISILKDRSFVVSRHERRVVCRSAAARRERLGGPSYIHILSPDRVPTTAPPTSEHLPIST